MQDMISVDNQCVFILGGTKEVRNGVFWKVFVPLSGRIEG
jgi:hypothetical protein